MLGSQFVVENTAGAGGTVGTAKVAAAAPDGHSLLVMHFGHAANTALYRNLRYDAVRDFEPDVEALLVNRVGEARECYRVGIDDCYRLVGVIRTHWRGLSGGTAVWDEIGRFFAGLKERSDSQGGAAHA